MNLANHLASLPCCQHRRNMRALHRLALHRQAVERLTCSPAKLWPVSAGSPSEDRHMMAMRVRAGPFS